LPAAVRAADGKLNRLRSGLVTRADQARLERFVDDGILHVDSDADDG
jgi:hypothetical protein